MKKFALWLSLAAVVLAGIVGWRVAACYIANAELQSDLNFISRQMGMTSGLSTPLSEVELRDAVIKVAGEDGISLQPDQVTAEKDVTETASTVHLAVQYDGNIDLSFFTLHPHFSLASTGTATLAPPIR